MDINNKHTSISLTSTYYLPISNKHTLISILKAHMLHIVRSHRLGNLPIVRGALRIWGHHLLLVVTKWHRRAWIRGTRHRTARRCWNITWSTVVSDVHQM